MEPDNKKRNLILVVSSCIVISIGVLVYFYINNAKYPRSEYSKSKEIADLIYSGSSQEAIEYAQKELAEAETSNEKAFYENMLLSAATVEDPTLAIQAVNDALSNPETPLKWRMFILTQMAYRLHARAFLNYEAEVFSGPLAKYWVRFENGNTNYDATLYNLYKDLVSMDANLGLAQPWYRLAHYEAGKLNTALKNNNVEKEVAEKAFATIDGYIQKADAILYTNVAGSEESLAPENNLSTLVVRDPLYALMGNIANLLGKESRYTKDFVENSYKETIAYADNNNKNNVVVNIYSVTTRFYLLSLYYSYSNLYNKSSSEMVNLAEDIVKRSTTFDASKNLIFLRERGDASKFSPTDSFRNTAIYLGKISPEFKNFLITTVTNWNEDDFK